MSYVQISRSFQGIWIPKEIWLDPDLSCQEKCLWSEIQSLGCSEKGCFASNEYLANFMGVKERRLQEMLAHLKERGLVTQSSFDGRTRFLKAELPKSVHLTGAENPHGRGAEKCTPPVQKSAPSLYIENIEENKEKSIAQNAPRSRAAPSISFSSQSQSFEGIEAKDTQSWKDAYPLVDVQRELVRMKEWILSNPSRSKKTLWRKFITGWLQKEQDKAYNQAAYASQKSKGPTVDRRTKDINGQPIPCPFNGKVPF